MNKEKLGYLLILGSIFSAAIMYITFDYAFRKFDELSPENAIFYANLGALLISSPYFLRSKKSRKNLKNTFSINWKIIILVAFLSAFGASLWFYAIYEAKSGLVALLNQSEILFAFLLGIIFLKEKISLKEIPGLFIAILGFFVLSNLDGEISALVVAAILISRLSYATQSFIIKKFVPKMDGFSFGFMRQIFMAIFIGVIFGLSGKITNISFTPICIVSLGMIFNVIIAKSLFFEAHKYLPISKLNLIRLLEPIAILIGTFLIFGDLISMQKLIGSILITFGLLLFIKEQSKK